jgi:hypothetical protein
MQAGIHLIPMIVDSDGSCLPHAISRGTVGMEIFYDCFRASMAAELRTHRAWYRANIPFLSLLDDEGFEEQYRTLIESATPTRGQFVSKEKYLEGVHIVAMANALMRPILLLDTPEKMRHIDASNVDGCGF